MTRWSVASGARAAGQQSGTASCPWTRAKAHGRDQPSPERFGRQAAHATCATVNREMRSHEKKAEQSSATLACQSIALCSIADGTGHGWPPTIF